jgi:6-phosphogluconolactonase (cycloisomerase 2 family)
MDPRSVTLDASGQFLYVGNTASNDVSAYVIDTDTGALMPTPGSPFPAGIIPLDLTADPSGRFLYVVNNGSNDVTVYSINNDTGSLSLIQTIASGGNAISIAIKESAHEVV